MPHFVCADSVRDDCYLSSPLGMFLEPGVTYQSQHNGLRRLWEAMEIYMMAPEMSS